MAPVISPADIEKIAKIIREETGNQVREKNHSMIVSRMSTHLMKMGLQEMNSYWQHFANNEVSEREILKGLFTTHYTFFFREYSHFEVLQKWIDDNVNQLRSRGTPLIVWCAAASRGQEIYSLAMFLDINLTKKYGINYEIMGTDIDAESVSYGKNGVYPIKEVSTIPHEYLEPYWKKGSGNLKDYAAVIPLLRGRVKFESLNLLHVPDWKNNDAFDVIFCRNVFIYFTEDDVKKIALNLVNRLAPNGLFVSGVSEPLRFKEWNYPTVGPSCYQKGAVAQASVPLKSVSAAPVASPVNVSPVAVSEVKKKYKVLCVDDSGTIQALIKKIFSTDPDCEKVVSAMNGREARTKLDNEKFDLITLDIHMPEVNGIEFLENLYNRKVDPPVIMVSSVNRQDLELATKSLSLGAFDYVEKPAMNNLQKSMAEIIMKGKMARRAKQSSGDKKSNELEFDASIAQKIVIPDASMCLRIVRGSKASMPLVSQVIKGQNKESRSPALLVVFNHEDEADYFNTQALEWTQRAVVHLREHKGVLRPNHIYVCTDKDATAIISNVKSNRVSVQILDAAKFDWTLVTRFKEKQVLVDENLTDWAKNFSSSFGMPVSDITPATSFPSLSVEYFANFRKAAS